MPIMSLVVEGNKSQLEFPFFKFIELFNINDFRFYSIILILYFGLIICISASLRILNIFLNGRISGAIGNDFGYEIFSKSLYQPLRVHIQRNNSVLITTLTQHINITVNFVNSSLQLVASSFVAISLIIGLLMINFRIAVLSSIFFLACYFTLGYFNRKKLAQNSSFITSNLSTQYKLIVESLTSIRDILLRSNQDYFIKSFNNIDKPVRIKRSQIYFIGLFPRYLLEAIGLLFLSFVFLFVVIFKSQNALILPLIGSFALGSQKLLPALQQVFTAWSLIKSTLSQANEVVSLLNRNDNHQYYLKNSSFASVKNTKFKRAIEFKNVFFKYDLNSNKFTLNDINLKINKGDYIGLIGKTGSGKSTLIDLFMNLLDPTNGDIIVDGIKINDPNNFKYSLEWRAKISLVPQSIFLTDNSIYENVAFGIPYSSINKKRVKKVCQIAQISEFIESLKDGYETMVGERAIKLSGGQAQRIGIARALYNKSQILILDEATSALDNTTEINLLNSIFDNIKDITVIMIAHRLSSLKYTNRILEIKSGKLFEK